MGFQFPFLYSRLLRRMASAGARAVLRNGKPNHIAASTGHGAGPGWYPRLFLRPSSEKERAAIELVDVQFGKTAVYWEKK